MKISNRINKVSYSFTVALKHEAEKRKARGEKIIDLGLGEIKFGQPPEFTKALISVAKKGVNEYTYAGGTDEIRSAISEANNSLFGGVYKSKIIQPHYNKSEIIHGTSAKLLILAAAYSITEINDDVIVLVPFWPPYIDTLKLIGINPIIAQTKFKNNFTPSKEILEKSLTSKSKAIIINSPNNPSGRVFKKQELGVIYNFAKKHDLLIISDEVYDTIVFENYVHQSIASLSEDVAKRTVVIKGLSKGFGMGGLRFGYAMSKNKKMIDAMTKVISNTITAPPSLLQEAGPALFLKSTDHILKIRKNFEKRVNFTMKRFREMKLPFTQVEGAPYIFPKVSSFYNKGIKNSHDFMARLIEETGIVILHGESCGNDEHIRIALIQDIPVLKKAWDKLEIFLKKYAKD